jgi:hypothetical protein
MREQNQSHPQKIFFAKLSILPNSGLTDFLTQHKMAETYRKFAAAEIRFLRE